MIQTIPLFVRDRSLLKFLYAVNPGFSSAQLTNAARICQGLCSSLSHKSLTTIAESLLIPRDQSSLNRFLTESEWGAKIREMDINRAGIMQKNRQTAINSNGIIIIDDTLLEKTGTKMDLVGQHFDHCSFTMKQGLSLVSLNYCDEVKNYNLFKEVYLRKEYLKTKEMSDRFQTKVELACDMLTILIESVPSFLKTRPRVVFDSWYLANDITTLLENYELKYVSRAKNNRIIKGLDMNLKEYANTVLRDSDFTPYPRERDANESPLLYYEIILPISKLGDVKVIFLKLKQEQTISCFIVSNDLRLSAEEIIELYKLRWGIETDYKFSKQELGLSDFHLRTQKGILRYFTICFIASTYLEYAKLLGLFGRYFGKHVDLSTKGKRVRAYRHLMFERFLIWLEWQFSSGQKLFDLLNRFRSEEISSPQGIEFVYHNTHLSLIYGTC